jgi:hypothetical protein
LRAPIERITFDPAVMGGKPCIRGMRVKAAMIVDMVASGHDTDEILRLYRSPCRRCDPDARCSRIKASFTTAGMSPYRKAAGHPASTGIALSWP